MNEKLNEQTFCAHIVFLGDTLGPFYLNDPEKDQAIVPAFAAFQSLDVFEAALEWPFVESEKAARDLSLMQEGLSEGLNSEALVWEYRRLFVGPAKKPAPPWGSVYTDRECVVRGESTLALRQWLRETGVVTLEDQGPEDHIGLMLLLMSWLAQNRPELLEDYLRLHLLTWSSHFLDELIEAAEQPFYKGLAQLTKESLEGLQAELDLTIEYPRYYR